MICSGVDFFELPQASNLELLKHRIFNSRFDRFANLIASQI
jgi:hypothetical protein